MKSLLVLLPAALTLLFSNAQAYDFVSSPYLLGDWGGNRSKLADEGIVLGVGYTAEVGHNYVGGTKKLTEYADQWAFGANLDSEKLGIWKGGNMQMTFTDRNGKNLGADAGLGNDMLVQEVYGRGQTWHMTQFWYNQKFFDNRFEIKLGRLTVGEDFDSFSCDFQNLTFCGSQPGNLVGSYWINWPTSVWATRLKYHFDEEKTVQIGAYQINPIYASDVYAQNNGLTFDTPAGTTGFLIPLEYSWSPSFQGHTGSYKFGGWFNTSQSADLAEDVDGGQQGLTGNPPLQHGGQYGFYISFQQEVTGSTNTPGMSVFLNVTQADPLTAAIDRQIALGTQYHGIFDRMGDVVGFAIGTSNNNIRYANFVQQTDARTGSTLVAGGGSEYATELYYNFLPIESFYLRPNLQYIITPGGTAQNPNAFVAGLKSGITF